MTFTTMRAVVLDWAGTMIDYGCFAPVVVVHEVFRRRGIILTNDEARGPMGKAKRDHLREILELPDVATRWQAAHGRVWSEADVDALYAEFLPLELEIIGEHCALIPGALDALADVRRRGMRVGTTTGYNHTIMERVLPAAAAQGYSPDALVCPEDVGAGRPAPYMLWRNLTLLDVYPAAACVKVGDTIADIAEGRNAGAWCVGLTRSGNELGLTHAETQALDPADLAARLATIGARMQQAGAQYVIESVTDLPSVLDAITARLAAGERP